MILKDLPNPSTPLLLLFHAEYPTLGARFIADWWKSSQNLGVVKYGVVKTCNTLRQKEESDLGCVDSQVSFGAKESSKILAIVTELTAQWPLVSVISHWTRADTPGKQQHSSLYHLRRNYSPSNLARIIRFGVSQVSAMPINGLPAILLFAVTVISAPQYEFPATTMFSEVTCFKCDDASLGCQPEHVTTEVCQRGTTACMVELFFTPNSTKMFNFRAGCSARHSCPEGYTQLMCTDFINGVKTCRLCCFENNCVDPTPGSNVRVSVMKDLLLNSGFSGESVDTYLAHENEIAFNRGVTTTSAQTTTTAATTLAFTTTPAVDPCTSTPISKPSTDILQEEGFEGDGYDSTRAEQEDERVAHSPRRGGIHNVVNENLEGAEEEEEERGVEYLNPPVDHSEEVRAKKMRGRLTDSQEIQMNDQTYNEEANNRAFTAVLWGSSSGAGVRDGVCVASTLLVMIAAAVGAAVRTASSSVEIFGGSICGNDVKVQSGSPLRVQSTANVLSSCPTAPTATSS
ncbi:hypothetical protein TcWFU_009684 [Taenia crassiceps]|uniref:Uncharacterized protein n=1 Tax=Taenia crassiceps TaxID=6207 RepID=A0ABR4Q737_9CEST